MIGNVTAWGRRGYTILEEGDLDPVTRMLRVRHYLVADRNGETVPQRFPSLEVARAYIEALEEQ
ncbi:hypothetical protein [Alcanivorax quisquiliarum]|uniref:Uncharacterized protein n=1 Tax=Alcanivorax quisquiliarum TaxID=2933565 RepID=A0ABT0E444_9GAMM|nr:hypothetical protein [Alcanivorax quisquiliarum]MCK0536538.1 hypothetical protein [Alcanivorax quisquiliarum]